LMQNNFAVMGDMIKGDITFDGTVFAERANDFVALAGMPWVAFDQPGAKPGKDTNALPAIWENWDDFMKKAEQFQNDAKALQQAALSGNQNDIRRAFMTTARNCKACHDAYKDRKSTRLNSSHVKISYAVFCLKKKINKDVTKY